jgi:hypothetical protein
MHGWLQETKENTFQDRRFAHWDSNNNVIAWAALLETISYGD